MFQVTSIIVTSGIMGAVIAYAYDKLDRRIDFWRVIFAVVVCNVGGFYLANAGVAAGPTLASILAVFLVSSITKGSIFILLPLVAGVRALFAVIAYWTISSLI